MIQFWAEQKADVRAGRFDSTKWIGQINPRRVHHDGRRRPDISIDSGQKLYDAAGEPRSCGSSQPQSTMVARGRAGGYEQRVVGFFDQYLLGE